jgi:hypothetical protein
MHGDRLRFGIVKHDQCTHDPESLISVQNPFAPEEFDTLVLRRQVSRVRKAQATGEILDPRAIALLCSIQQGFVKYWNRLEKSMETQSHALPCGAKYSGFLLGGRGEGFSVVLPGPTWICVHAKRGWWHWHEGWSFLRNACTVNDVRKVVVHGSADEAGDWLVACSNQAGFVFGRDEDETGSTNQQLGSVSTAEPLNKC